MELVLLADCQNSYAAQWIRVASTAGLKDVRIGDRFREQGFGPGSEEFQVDGIDISPVSGASKLFVIRAANATQPMTHRLGAVLEQVGIATKAVDPAYQPLRETLPVDAPDDLNAALAAFAEPVLVGAAAKAPQTPAERQKAYRERKRAAG